MNETIEKMKKEMDSGKEFSKKELLQIMRDDIEALDFSNISGDGLGLNSKLDFEIKVTDWQKEKIGMFLNTALFVENLTNNTGLDYKRTHNLWLKWLLNLMEEDFGDKEINNTLQVSETIALSLCKILNYINNNNYFCGVNNTVNHIQNKKLMLDMVDFYNFNFGVVFSNQFLTDRGADDRNKCDYGISLSKSSKQKI